MIAATGAKNGAGWPQTHFATAHEAATRSPPAPPSASPPGRARDGCASRRATARRRPPRGSQRSRRYSTRSSPSSGSANARPAELPAFALIERARASGAVGRVQPDRLVALARGLLQPERMQSRRQAAPPPARPQEQHPQVRAALDPHVRALALAGVGDADVPGGLAVRRRAPSRTRWCPRAAARGSSGSRGCAAAGASPPAPTRDRTRNRAGWSPPAPPHRPGRRSGCPAWRCPRSSD